MELPPPEVYTEEELRKLEDEPIDRRPWILRPEYLPHYGEEDIKKYLLGK